MIYITLFLVIVAISFLQLFGKKDIAFWFIIFGIVLTLLSMFRFGSGTDYLSYMVHYNLSPDTIGDSMQYQSHMNIGYQTLVGVFKSFHLDFEIFIAFISSMVMLVYLKTINKNSRFRLLSLLIFYAVYYSIYVDNALRQGIAMSIFFIAFYKYFKNGKTFKYLLMIILASLFHNSALIMLLIPIIRYVYKKMFYNKILNTVLLLSSLLLCLLKFSNIVLWLGSVFGMDAAYKVTSFNPMAITLRIISLIFIFILYKSNKKDISEFDKLQIYVYFLGSVLFISVANIQVLSRILEYFTMLEIILIPNLIKLNSIERIKVKTTKVISFVFVIVFIGTIFIKDISSFVEQGNYYEGNAINYKYITIYNKEDLYKYRNVYIDIFDYSNLR